LTAPPLDAPPLQPGETITTADRLRLHAERLVTDLHDVVDLALLESGGVLVAERAGSLRIIPDDRRLPSSAVDGGIASLAIAPDYPRSRHVFVIHTPPGAFRIVRYRVAGHALVDRMPLLRDVAASADAAAVLRFGPDGRLYAAFDDGGSREAAARPSEWNGKVLRLNPDGGTPDDQPAASPVFWSGLRAPRGLGWKAGDDTLWIAEERSDRLERLAALAIESLRPRRSAQRASYPLPQPFGARALVFHPGGGVPGLRGDLLLAANDAGYLLRIRFDAADPRRIVTSERLLEGRIGPVRAVAVASDGSIYVASDSSLWRLSAQR
jgi:glucose/arabinose dehydrogenase